MTKLSPIWENIGILVLDTLPRVADASREMIAGEVRAELARRKINARELAAELDVPETTFYKMLSADRLGFNEEILVKLRRYLNKPPDWPKEDPTAVREYYNKADSNSTGTIALRGRERSAKTKTLPIAFCVPEWEAIQVADSSHMPAIHPGDILTFVQALKPRMGYMHIVQMSNDPEDIAPWIIDHVDGEDRLLAINPKVVAPAVDDAKLVGIVTGWYHDDPPGFDSRLNPAGLKW